MKHILIGRVIALAAVLLLPSFATAQRTASGGGGITNWYFSTNLFGLLFTNSSMLYVDAVHGNDTTAIHGRQDKAWKTIGAAATNMRSGSKMIISPGAFNVDPWATNESYVFYSNSIAPIEPPARLTNIVIEGAGMGLTRIVATNVGHILSLNDLTNFAVRNLTFQAPKHVNLAAGDYFACIILRGTNGHGLFENVEIDGFAQHGISDLEGPRLSHHITVRHCAFKEIGCTNHGSQIVDGTAISGIGSHWLIEDCDFIGNLRDVEIESVDFTNRIHGVSIVNNRMLLTVEKSIMVWPSVAGHNVSDVLISGNTISNMTHPASFASRNPINISGGDNIIITGNIIDGSTGVDGAEGYGIYCLLSELTRNLVIKDNILRGIGYEPIRIAGNFVTNVTISGNTIANTSKSTNTSGAIFLSAGNLISVHDNSFWDAAPGGSCIYVASSTVRDLIIRDNIQHNTASSATYPLWGINIATTVARGVQYHDNTFKYVQIRGVTNAGSAYGLPCSQVSSNAPSDTLDTDPQGSIWVTAGATGGTIYIRTNSTWIALAQQGGQIAGTFYGNGVGLTNLTAADNVTNNAALTRDIEWDTAAEINAKTTDTDFLLLSATNQFASTSYVASAISNIYTTSHNWSASNHFNLISVDNLNVTTLNVTNVIYESTATIGTVTVGSGSAVWTITTNQPFTLTFSGTATNGTMRTILVTNSAGTNITVTIPSSYSLSDTSYITSVTQPAGTLGQLTFFRQWGIWTVFTAGNAETGGATDYVTNTAGMVTGLTIRASLVIPPTPVPVSYALSVTTNAYQTLTVYSNTTLTFSGAAVDGQSIFLRATNAATTNCELTVPSSYYMGGMKTAVTLPAATVSDLLWVRDGIWYLSAGYGAGWIAENGGTGTNVTLKASPSDATGTALTVLSNAVFQANIIARSWSTATNVMSSTNSLDMLVGEPLIEQAGTISISNLVNVSATEVRTAFLTVIGNGNDLRVPDSWRSVPGGQAKVWAVTNGILGQLMVRSVSGRYTNYHYEPVY